LCLAPVQRTDQGSASLSIAGEIDRAASMYNFHARFRLANQPLAARSERDRREGGRFGGRGVPGGAIVPPSVYCS